MRSYDIYKFDKEKTMQMSTIYSENGKSDEFVKSDFLFICGECQSEFNKSAKLVINKENEKQEMFLDNHDIINFYTITLYFYYLGDFERALTEIRNNLYSYYKKRESKIYSGYDKAIKEIQKFKMMFNNIVLSDMCYIDERLKSSLNYQNERFQNLLKNIMI